MIVLSENSIIYTILSMDHIQLCIIFYANAIECVEKEKSYFARPQTKQFILYSFIARVERKDKDPAERLLQQRYYAYNEIFFIMNTP